MIVAWYLQPLRIADLGADSRDAKKQRSDLPPGLWQQQLQRANIWRLREAHHERLTLAVDGSGAPSFVADIAIKDGKIVAVGKAPGQATRTLDADGLVVAPGWVDIHTHYDGQVSWDVDLAQSLSHGVTTAVIGNCGVGFAPVAPDNHDSLIGLMEGVEDIPGASLRAGMKWNWETFPQYLDALDAVPRTFDVAAFLAHGALRAYVMGERGAANEAATADDLSRMADMVKSAMQAGAVGFSTSRPMVAPCPALSPARANWSR